MCVHVFVYILMPGCLCTVRRCNKELDTLGPPNLGADEMGGVEVHCWVRLLLVGGCGACADLLRSHTAVASSCLVQLQVARTLHAVFAL